MIFDRGGAVKRPDETLQPDYFEGAEPGGGR
jgi:hypothetical protein